MAMSFFVLFREVEVKNITLKCNVINFFSCYGKLVGKQLLIYTANSYKAT